ncbi:MAG: alanine-tRNA synthetase second additional domain-containing protein [Halothermotrichaceae bacterium]
MVESFAHSVYFAPRGKDRLMFLGNYISQRYLHANDRLIGLIGDAGAGKSLLTKGMFPGLILTNDDEGINMRPLPVLNDYQQKSFNSHTYHVDIRFETAFNQPWQLAEAIENAVKKDCRVIVEHFDLIEEHLDILPELLIGIGEEVLVTRPGVFGPFSEEISKIVFKSIKYRRMAHTAEDLTAMVIEKKGYMRPPLHSDVKSGFVLQFSKKPDFSIKEIENEVKEYIANDIIVSYHDDEHIKIGTTNYACTGPRIHIRSTGKIKGFRLLSDYKIDPRTGYYLLAGFVGDKQSQFQLSHI